MTTQPLNPAFTCPFCQSDLLKLGYNVQLVSYQTYMPGRRGRMLKKHSSGSAVETVHCLKCGHRVEVTAQAPKEAA